MSSTNLKQVFKAVSANSRHWVGDGLPVHNIVGGSLGVRLNPFILLDYVAPHYFEPSEKPRGVGFHPHRGFETVTLAFQGGITHTDNAGHSDTIHSGDVQWMTAGSGVEHAEKHAEDFTKSGGTLEMIQLWINLPSQHKMTAPKYQAITSKTIPSVPLAQGSGLVKVVAGEYNGVKGPASTFTPMNILSIKLNGSTDTTIDVPEGWVSAALVRNGQVTVNGQTLKEKELVALEREGTAVNLKSDGDSELVLMTGEPIDEPVASRGPMVMNTEEELTQAFRDFKAGKFGAPMYT